MSAIAELVGGMWLDTSREYQTPRMQVNWPVCQQLPTANRFPGF